MSTYNIYEGKCLALKMRNICFAFTLRHRTFTCDITLDTLANEKSSNKLTKKTKYSSIIALPLGCLLCILFTNTQIRAFIHISYVHTEKNTYKCEKGPQISPSKFLTKIRSKWIFYIGSWLVNSLILFCLHSAVHFRNHQLVVWSLVLL